MWKFFDDRAKRLGIMDTKLLAGAAMCFTVVIVKRVPEILDLSGWWFVAFAVLLVIKPMITFYGPGPRS